MARDFVEITIQQDRLRQIGRMLDGVRNGLPKVVTRSINRTATQARGIAVRELAAVTGMKQKDLRREGVRLLRASWAKWRARLFFDGDSYSLGLEWYQSVQTAEGVQYRVGSKTFVERGAFLATMRSGHRGVWRREGKPRLPIYELFEDSIAAQAERSGILARVQSRAGIELERQLDIQVKVLLEKNRG